ncbi:GMC oxidoreductase [Piscinibacter terrae]|uniref:GMC family oxidoreductase n=1 Tax=Piscinibacter terrae TaxID=2496871 RepID=A0A3N7HMB6_9BURK|nr:GMC family oxidoreductase [Albitalea terrae]RQP21771.1 GMC family oxidoreductase [Albitalea terrae]
MSSPPVLYYDVVIIGSGVGGGCVATQLAGTNLRTCILERGSRLPREMENWDAEAVFVDQRYRTHEHWEFDSGKSRPGQYYYVGGLTKFFGAAMFRFRVEDFEEVQHEDGVSPAWPIRYSDLEPWYGQAERLFGVRGGQGADPTEPWRTTTYPFPPIPHEPVLASIEQRLRQASLHPSPMPAAVDYGSGGKCQRCGTCDAFPCRIGAKGDAEVCLIDPALRQPNVSLRTGVKVNRLLTDSTGRRIVAAEVEEGGEVREIHAETFILAAGAVNSSVILQRSSSPLHSSGLANSSGVVGRHFMNHNCTGLMALHPLRSNHTRFPKTLSVNDFYFGDTSDPSFPYPLGNLQLLGKLSEPMVRAAMPSWMPRQVGRWLTGHSVDWYVMSEDLPHPESTVRLTSSGQIKVHWERTNRQAHQRWVKKATAILKKIGYPVVLARPFTVETPSHQCGTVRFGTDPAASALDPMCKAWDHDNLYVVDASFFPSSAALNPALTIAAQALRVGHHLRTEVLR